MVREVMRSSWEKLSTKIVGALLCFLTLALLAIGMTLFLSWQLEGSSAAINETGSLRMQSYRLTMLVTRLDAEPFEASLRPASERQVQLIDATLLRLTRGDPQRPLFLPPGSEIQHEFGRIRQVWQRTLRPGVVSLLEVPERQPARLLALQRNAEDFVAQVDGLVRLIERDSEQRTFWLRGSQLVLLGMAICGTVSMIYLMFMLIIEPVTRLREGMERMTDKDFSVRLPVESEDEFGQLADGFNQMADHLQALYGSLEDRVSIKTAELEDQNRELALLYGIAAFLQRPLPLEALCEGFLQRIREYFVADGGSVRVLDAVRGNLHMVVHHGLSVELVEAEHCLKVGDCLCGEAVEKKITMVHDMRTVDRDYKLQCHREGFATVSVFHIHAHEQHMGFFNLHFREPKVFSKREESLLETLGQVLGIALENLRLAAREREMAISEERNLVAQGLHDSIAQSLNYLNLQVQMLDDSVKHARFEEVAGIVPALRLGVQESYEDVRELLLNFRSRLMEDDLIGSLQITIDKFRRQTGIAAELVADVDGAPFPREQQLQLLFIVQEALSNIRKHALASRVEVRLQDSQDFKLTIHDNGIGFDADTLLQKGESHVGIHIMRERAQRIDASFAVSSVPGRGTTVELHLRHEQRRAA
ncbi:type IV pili methyl-accepting chemotaxis transducer N-terminal domain-containing protein [Janthinobacterium fluminis]|uniref:Sensor protein n=1 Tax=Janthinobacterium fluminis TaxID=2987524 RepID=A0ABT5JWB9_9BURK|nr:type IV pili methyl-accepting chemotaxis transducer N-terminal domain-containing protein [Janthinobacterium fluminis]MDC8757027.1 type IV pili methyl-accepting chemotaxis transducer N-terminal domain-containing protein [Janthinobacterium fluminis]